MKKIILLLTVLTLGVIACDKNELGDMDSSSINPIEAKVETAIDTELLVANILKAWSSNELPKSTRGDASNTRRSNNYQVIHAFVDGNGDQFITLLDDTNDDLCFDSLTTAPNPIYLDDSAGDGSEISLEDGNGNVSATVYGNFTAFFNGTSNYLIKLGPNFSLGEIASFDDSNSATFAN